MDRFKSELLAQFMGLGPLKKKETVAVIGYSTKMQGMVVEGSHKKTKEPAAIKIIPKK